MKNDLKPIFGILLIVILTLTLNSCGGGECTNGIPFGRIINSGKSNVKVEIQNPSGGSSYINNIAPNSYTNDSNYSVGNMTFKFNVNNNQYVKSFQMINCYYYSITIDSNNTITSNSKEMDTEKKF